MGHDCPDYAFYDQDTRLLGRDGIADNLIHKYEALGMVLRQRLYVSGEAVDSLKIIIIIINIIYLLFIIMMMIFAIVQEDPA